MSTSKSNVRPIRTAAPSVLAFLVLSHTLSLPVFAADGALMMAGEAIYKSQCVSCHGIGGVGTAQNYPDPLVGDASIGELAELISDTMPEEDPDLCVGKDALAVATFIHESFYGDAAQLRNRPPRQSLQRLTGTQLRQSLTDLHSQFSGFTDTSWKTTQEKQGLQADYYDGRGWEKKNWKFKRVDPVVNFDYGIDGPGEGIAGDEFHVHWDGGLRVEQTGLYEIIVRSKSAFEFYLGTDQNMFIDNRVQSGGLEEFRQSVMLTGGRVVRMKLDLYQRKRKDQKPPSSVSISWIPPGGVEQIIPAKFLVPGWVPSTLSLVTQTPPDDSSYGFERGIAVDPAWDESVTSAALEFADAAAGDLWRMYQDQQKDKPESREEKLRAFLTQVISAAHRGQKESPTVTPILDFAYAGTTDESQIIKRAVLLALKSPRFLYPHLDADQSPSQRAGNRLALVLHDSLPSGWILPGLITQNNLTTPDQIRQAARQMIDDARTRAKLRHMLHGWLEIESDAELMKDPEKYAGFDAAMVADLRASMDAFLDEVIWSESSDYRQLLAADWSMTNDRISAFYGPSWAAAEGGSGEFRPTVRDAKSHVGVLTHPLLLAQFSYFENSSPIHRGVFLIRHVMGRTLRPPNEAFAPLSPDLHPNLSTRGRVELQTSAESCQICHAKINPLGFALENFDAVGKFRSTDYDQPIDASGTYLTRDDQTIRFDGARQLADYAITSHDAHAAFVTKMFQYFTKQPIAAYGTDRLDMMTEQFRQTGFNVKELLVEIAFVAAQDLPTPTSTHSGT